MTRRTTECLSTMSECIKTKTKFLRTAFRAVLPNFPPRSTLKSTWKHTRTHYSRPGSKHRKEVDTITPFRRMSFWGSVNRQYYDPITRRFASHCSLRTLGSDVVLGATSVARMLRRTGAVARLVAHVAAIVAFGASGC